jgi:hypothetical protein
MALSGYVRSVRDPLFLAEPCDAIVPAFGFCAALLEGLPIVGVFFSVSNRIVSELLFVTPHHPRTWREPVRQVRPSSRPDGMTSFLLNFCL